MWLQVQLIRIQVRVPEYGWTTQKVFHLLNVLVNGGLYIFLYIPYERYICLIVSNCKYVVNAVRCLIFVFHQDVQQLKPEVRNIYIHRFYIDAFLAVPNIDPLCFIFSDVRLCNMYCLMYQVLHFSLPMLS